jgi:hypothetical protein
MNEYQGLFQALESSKMTKAVITIEAFIFIT